MQNDARCQADCFTFVSSAKIAVCLVCPTRIMRQSRRCVSQYGEGTGPLLVMCEVTGVPQKRWAVRINPEGISKVLSINKFPVEVYRVFSYARPRRSRHSDHIVSQPSVVYRQSSHDITKLLVIADQVRVSALPRIAGPKPDARAFFISKNV
jgi:hypothetical protein